MEKWEKAKVFLLGMLAAAVLLLTAADALEPKVGRYQLSGNQIQGVFITDTTTGVTKWVAGREYNQLGLLFEEMEDYPLK